MGGFLTPEAVRDGAAGGVASEPDGRFRPLERRRVMFEVLERWARAKVEQGFDSVQVAIPGGFMQGRLLGLVGAPDVGISALFGDQPADEFAMASFGGGVDHRGVPQAVVASRRGGRTGPE